jgi:hypothetical protein
MADEAFALSPISARATLPSEEDYAAISEAFMETSRGRWFLTEYAKRNRNADTSMVLDAVARIEQSLAAQKEESLQREASAAAQQQAAAGISLAEALTAIHSVVEAAQASAAEALDALALEQKLAPVRKGARVIREIAWRLREIGNDGRICDLIDSQVSVIEAGAAEISSAEAKAALEATFASIADWLAELSDDEAPRPVAEAAVVAPSPVPQETAPEAVAEIVEAAPAQQASAGPTSSFFAEAELAEAEAALAEAEAGLTEAEASLAEEPDEIIDEAAADAHDEAILDMIAMEMGAPDPLDNDGIAAPIESSFAVPTPVEPELVAPAPEPVVAPVEPAPVAQTAVVQAAVIQAAPEAPLEISLGSSIIASGIVKKPVVAANDPLAPIRRMSQAEKIAFFS